MNVEGKQSRGFAFFDLDLTLVAYDTQLLFCNHVLRAEGWRRFYLFVFLPCALLYVLRLIGDHGLKRVHLSYLWGMSRTRLEAHVASFVEGALPAVLYEEIVEEVRRHREEGRRAVLNTASPEFYARAIADRIGFDDCFGTRVEVGERMALFPRFEGANNKGAAKIDAMREILPPWAVESGSAIADSYAFSDSLADLPLLELAEHPVMVHPSAALRRVGDERGWIALAPSQPYRGNAGRGFAYLRMVFGIWSSK